MTMDELFNSITQIIARPDSVISQIYYKDTLATEITEEQKRKAIQILCCVEDYLIDAMPGYCAKDCEDVIGDYVGRKLDEME
jgi:hypothetical protein